MKPRIVITGIAGFIGSNLADYLLQRDYEVVGIDNLAYGVKSQVPKAVDFHQVDVTDRSLPDLFKPDDIVFHLAAKNCISDCQDDPLDTVFNNIYGSVNVFESAYRRKVHKVVYAESSALYEASTTMPTPETDVHPESFYSLSKYAAMIFAKGYERYKRLTTTALRYFCVYGPRQDYRRTIPPVMSAFIIKLLRKERPTIYGTGERRRDFIHVDDINCFHAQCISDSRTDNKVFNLGSGKSYSVKQILAKINEIIGYDISPVYQDALPGEAEETLADISQAKQLGWTPNIGLETGLKELVDYYQKNRIPWLISTS